MAKQALPLHINLLCLPGGQMRYFLNLFFIIGPLLSLVACQKPPEPERAYGDTLIIGHFYPSAPNLNPLFSPSGVSAGFSQPLLFNGLVEKDQNMRSEESRGGKE